MAMRDTKRSAQSSTTERRRLLSTVALGIGAAVVGGVVHFRAAANTVETPPPPMLVRQGDRIVVPEQSPLRSKLSVRAAEARDQPHTVTIPAIVEADPSRTINILPPLTGRLTDLKVRLGDRVVRAQQLALIRSPDLEQAYADVDKARDALALAQRAQDRARGVYDAGATATKDLEQAESGVAQAKAEFNRAEARLKIIGAGAEQGQFRSATIVAPMSGVVTALATAAGAYINDATVSLMTIANLESVWVTANVPENLIRMISPGEDVSVLMPAYPGQTLHGTVSVVGAVVEADTHRTKVRIRFANPGEKLKPNMYANAVFSVPQDSQVVVPNSAILMNNDSTTVFVEVAPWTFTRREVELGAEDDDATRIRGGLKAGERIVVKGGILLND